MNRWQVKVPVVALFAAVALGGTGCADDATGTQSAPSASAEAAAPRASVKALVAPRDPAHSRAAPAPAGGGGKAASLLRSKPVRLRIASIGVDSSLMALGLRANGTMQVPPGAFPAGWYTGGPTPGERGPAVLAGHVDSSGPGVFYRLHRLKPGDFVNVTRADGSTPLFRVKQVRQFPKNRFPTRLVYGNIDHAGLRLITCGGSFNSQSGHYDDNLVVFADLVKPEG